MDNIIEPSNSFDFSKLTLADPTSIPGNAYFTRILFDKSPLYIQSPKSTTRQGFVKTGKKINCDLMFESIEGGFIHWLENLEAKCQELIYEKSGEWFQNSLELSDIESAFNSPMKSFKSGKYYLVRTNVKINSLTNNALIKIYNESETPLTLDDITCDSTVISILEVQGIKFTSRNFQIEIDLKQVMLLNKDILFENCLIKKKTSGITIMNPPANVSHNLSISAIEKDELDEEEEQDNREENLSLEEVNTEKIANSNEPEEREEKNQEQENTIIEEDLVIEDGPVALEATLCLKEDEKDFSENIPQELVVECPKNTGEIDDLEEVQFGIDLENNLETIALKKPNDVYYEMYKQAREKAKNAKKEALLALLEAKNIKQTYMLEDIDSSDESTFSDEEEMEKEDFY